MAGSADPAPRLWRRLSSAGAGAAAARTRPAPEDKGAAPIVFTELGTASSTKLAAAAAVAGQPVAEEAADSQPLIKAAYPGEGMPTQPAMQLDSSAAAVINSPRGVPAELPQLQPRRPPPPPPTTHSAAAGRPRQPQAAAAVLPFRFERLG